jgi:erythronate-4-phosphate dehydrogenase
MDSRLRGNDKQTCCKVLYVSFLCVFVPLRETGFSSDMKIIADENIPCVTQAFSTLGEVILRPGRQLCAADVRTADILLVRSVTSVGRELLEGSKVRFVGSATIGFDHVDRDYLRQQGIGFATAPGSNATSAAEYVVSALLALAERDGFDPADKSVGIIGCGNVGSRVLQKLTALGMRCLVNDPPLQAQGGHGDFVGLDDILQADIITLHVPLTQTGAHPTWHLVDTTFLESLKPGAILINTARGAVVDNRALDAMLDERDDLSVVLDVWEGEPAINRALLGKVALGTPHIAGYSLNGKLRGTEMIYRAACDYLGLPARGWKAADNLPEGRVMRLEEPRQDTLQAAVFDSYDVRRDDRGLRTIMSLGVDEYPEYFDRLRKEYPLRLEFHCTTLMADGINAGLQEVLLDIGFNIAHCRETRNASFN